MERKSLIPLLVGMCRAAAKPVGGRNGFKMEEEVCIASLCS